MVLLSLTNIDSTNEFTFIDEERGEILVKIENLSEKKNYVKKGIQISCSLFLRSLLKKSL